MWVCVGGWVCGFGCVRVCEPMYACVNSREREKIKKTRRKKIKVKCREKQRKEEQKRKM